MIPTLSQCLVVWDETGFPEQKRRHTWAVLAVARVLSAAVKTTHPSLDTGLIDAAVMLHDIDKNLEKRPSDRHPDASVRLVRERGYSELAAAVARHPLHMILDSRDAPSSLEEKIVFLADKMAKYEPIGVEARFALWRAEDLPEAGRRTLEAAYPRVVALATELTGLAGMGEADVIARAKNDLAQRPRES